jgi:hypothetical protein
MEKNARAPPPVQPHAAAGTMQAAPHVSLCRSAPQRRRVAPFAAAPLARARGATLPLPPRRPAAAAAQLGLACAAPAAAACMRRRRRAAATARWRAAASRSAAPEEGSAADGDEESEWDAELEELWGGWEDAAPENFLAVVLSLVALSALALVGVRILVVLCSVFLAALKYTAVAGLLVLFGVFFA